MWKGLRVGFWPTLLSGPRLHGRTKEAQSAYSCLHRLGAVVFPLGSTKSLCSTREPKLLSLLSPPVVGPDCPNYDADYQQQHHHHFKYNDHQPQTTSHKPSQAPSHVETTSHKSETQRQPQPHQHPDTLSRKPGFKQAPTMYCRGLNNWNRVLGPILL